MGSYQMSSNTRPVLAIGMPVFNGERYLESTVESILAQDFVDFELVISDNGSTDATADICAQYAAGDARIRYIRHDQNRGAAWNYNYVFQITDSEFFKWAACDDLLAPEYASECLSLLRVNPEAVLCHTLTADIDETGVVTRAWHGQPNGTQTSAVDRFTDLVMRRHQCFPVFGIIRSDVLRHTNLIGAYTESDDVLVAELALFGRFLEVPDCLFFRREHPERSVTAHQRTRERTGWFDPSREGRIVFPTWRIAREYVRSVSTAPLNTTDRLRCLGTVAEWMLHNSEFLVRNVLWAVREVVFRGMRRPTQWTIGRRSIPREHARAK